MIIDENEFFRQITLRICGSLEITTAIHRCLLYLEQIIPVDWIFLHLYERGLGMIRTVVRANREKAEEVDILTPVPPEAREKLDSETLVGALIVSRPELDPVSLWIINRPELDPTYRMNPYVDGINESSLLFLRLRSDGRWLGSIVLRAKGKDRYIEEHARLLSLVHEPFVIAFSNALKHQEVLKLKDMLTDENRQLQMELFHRSGEEIIGMEFGLKRVMEMVRQVAPTDSPVFLRGETGVGKEVVANAIHNLSPRREGPFIKVNCGAIPETLLDSELFGHEKGAFTGAIAQKRGYFERANHGTIFLDEIGELPPAAQVRMLRVLQHKEIQRVGGTSFIPVDIRIIAATHRKIEDLVKAERFREDLWFRLSVFPLLVPPLRDRKHDIPAFVAHFIKSKSKDLRISEPLTLAPGVIDRLIAYDWPGNVRELENVIERELILNKGEALTFNSLFTALDHDYQPVAPETQGRLQHLDDMVSSYIRRVLIQTKGKVHGPQGAAALLGINASTLRAKMNKLNIPYGRATNHDST